MRLQRALARAGVASRRACEGLIRAGRVRVNGSVATVGMVVDPGHDRITVGGRALPTPRRHAWIALHKPVGYVTTKRDPQGRPTVYELVPEIPGLVYIGRLDVMTEGLLLFTTDGEAVHELTHPRFGAERSYRAMVRGGDAATVRRRLAAGIRIGGRSVGIVRYGVRVRRGGELELRLTLREGRNRIVRRVCEALGLTMLRLVRLSHGPVTVGGLAPGAWRYLSDTEINRVRRSPTQ